MVSNEKRILALTHDLAVLVDETGQIVFANQRFLDSVGLKESEVLSKNFFFFVRKNDVFLHEDVLQRDTLSNFMNGSIFKNHIMLNVGKEMTPFSLNFQFDITTRLFTCMFINTSSAENLFERVCEQMEKVKDVNAKLKSMQGRLVQNGKMAALGALSAGVAHEINNPLAYVLSNISSLKEYVDVYLQVQKRLLPILENTENESISWQDVKRSIQNLHEKEDLTFIAEDMPKVLLEIEEGANRVKTIVQDLRCFTHNENDELGLVDINMGLENSIKMVQSNLRFKCSFDVELGEIPLVRGNAGQLNQVFMNLLVNAGQAIQNDGKIKVRTFFKIDQVIIKIEDNGVGIEPDKLNQIFDPFYTTKGVGEGTGLGMSIVYGIIQEHKGYIDLASVIGVGTEFQIYLPCAK